MSDWGTKIEIERRRRYLVSLWAYAYEFLDLSLVSDEKFDTECKLVDPTISTGHDVLDEFFRNKFVDYSGSWIHDHPELENVGRAVNRLFQHEKGSLG